MIAERLDGAGIPYMVTGSVALAVYATPRMTRDIDFVVQIDRSDVAAQPIEIEGLSVNFVAPEDLILSKLSWARDSASELQERDVRDLLDAVEDLDLDYLQRWAAELGVGETLERLRQP